MQSATSLSRGRFVSLTLSTLLWGGITVWIIHNAIDHLQQFGWQSFYRSQMIRFGGLVLGWIILGIGWKNKNRVQPWSPRLKIIVDHDAARVRLSKCSPIAAFFMALPLAGFVILVLRSFTIMVAIGIFGLATNIPDATPYVWWSLLFGVALAAALWRQRMEKTGCEDLVVSNELITLPNLCGRKTTMTIQRITVREVKLETVVHKDSDGDEWRQYFPLLVLNDGVTHKVAEMHFEEAANDLVLWLRNQLRLS